MYELRKPFIITILSILERYSITRTDAKNIYN